MTRPSGMKAVLLLIGFILASGHFAEAQQPKKVHRIGFLSGSGHPSAFEALRQELRGFGHIEGENIILAIALPKESGARLQIS
jgi:hypothetical protein